MGYHLGKDLLTHILSCEKCKMRINGTLAGMPISKVLKQTKNVRGIE